MLILLVRGKRNGWACSSTANQACAASAPATSCNNDYKYTVGVPTGNYANMYMCTSDYIKCSTGNKSNSVDRALTTLSCPTGATAVDKQCTCPSNKPAYDPATNACVACTGNQVLNPGTGQCQAPCPPSGTEQSQFESMPGESYPGSFCSNGCEVRSEIVIDICGAISVPDAECSAQGNFFSYTGSMCGSGNPPPSGPQNPPGCKPGKEQVGNLCLPKCSDTTTRDSSDLLCKCTNSNQEMVAGTGQCFDKCPAGTVRNAAHQCEPTSCPPGMVKGTGPGGESACVPMQCPEGQQVSYLENKCVPIPGYCGEGLVMLGGKCVPKDQDCKKDEYFVHACSQCVKVGQPIPQCGQSSNDLDGDGQPNNNDNDMDGDGTPNSSDNDMDGDGIPNVNDPSPGGPGTTSGPSGPGTNDIDGDGTPNSQDGDMDGDGLPNGQDGDIDGDGVPNGQDGSPGGQNGNGNGDCDPATESCDSTNAGQPSAGPGRLYEPKGKSYADVWSTFVGQVKNAPVFKSGLSFSVSSIAATCPIWTLQATDFFPSITIDFQCGDSVADAMRVVGIAFLFVCAWIAFTIAFL